MGKTEECLEELETLKAEVEGSAGRYRGWRSKYEKLHYALGVPATVLAATAGATAFAANVPASVVGGCAGVAAVLAGLQTLIRPDEKSRFNHLQRINLNRLAGRDNKHAYRHHVFGRRVC